MNELTIEQKAQRYDEAIAHAKKLLKTIGNATLGNLVLKNEFEIMFPELAESEDEEIRKEMLQIAKESEDSFYMVMTPNKREKLIAWLKKQRDKDKLIQELGKYKVKYTQEVLSHQLKKQGEQKSAIYDSNVLEKHITKNSISELANSILIRNGWKVIEQNLTDKAEPKFHEGEWLCENEPNNYARFIQILNVQGKERYRISRDIHNDEDIVEFDFVEKYYHKFDIKDAKPGDVLASKNGAEILIFRKLDSSTSFSSYYNIKGRGEIGWSNRSFVPATKEQCGLLFQKMQEAGYEWDSDKKELKKIEQKPAENSAKVSESSTEEKDMGEYKKGFECGKQRVLKYPEDFGLCKKSAWSEEDEANLNEALSYIKDDALKEFIKSLRPQTTWKPSEEQFKSLKEVIDVGHFTSYPNALETLYEQLKQL